MTNDDKMTVTFTGKELFAQINDKLDKIVLSLETKASQEDMSKLEVRVDVLEEKSHATEVIAVALKAANEERQDSFTTKQKVIGLGFAAVTMILNIMALGPDVIH